MSVTALCILVPRPDRSGEKIMKKLLLIIGIVLIAAGVLALLFAGLNWFGYYRVLDGSAELYARLHRRTVVFGAAGLVLASLGTACLIIRSRL